MKLYCSALLLALLGLKKAFFMGHTGSDKAMPLSSKGRIYPCAAAILLGMPPSPRYLS